MKFFKKVKQHNVATTMLIISLFILASTSVSYAQGISPFCSNFGAGRNYGPSNGHQIIYSPGIPMNIGEYIVVTHTGTANPARVEIPSGNVVGLLAPNETFTYTVVDTSVVSIYVRDITYAGIVQGTISCSATAPPVPVPSSNGEIAEIISIPTAPDNRINWQFGDAHIGILYPGSDGAIDLYDYADEDVYHFDFISAEALAIFDDNLPNEPTIIATQGLLTAYLLPTGQIQINLGPDEEGKVFVVILNDLFDRDLSQSYYLDPNE